MAGGSTLMANTFAAYWSECLASDPGDGAPP
jgi:hypothetical protein